VESLATPFRRVTCAYCAVNVSVSVTDSDLTCERKIACARKLARSREQLTDGMAGDFHLLFRMPSASAPKQLPGLGAVFESLRLRRRHRPPLVAELHDQ